MSARTTTAVAATKSRPIPTDIEDSGSESSTSSDNSESENESSEEEESEDESVSNTTEKGEPPTKRVRTLVASPRKLASAPRKRRKKSLSLLPTMPLDILFEILGQLTPKDILNVSRINKSFHETLLASSAKTVWIRALEGAGAPECPSDFTEVRWARLLFGTFCECCGAKNVQKVDFFLRRRVCTVCKKKNLVAKSKAGAILPGCDDMVFSLIPSTSVGRSARGHTTSNTLYWRSDIEETIRLIASYKQKKHLRVPGAQNDFATFIALRMDLVDEIHTTGVECNTWSSGIAQGRYNQTVQSMKNRQHAIRAKFLELGYDEADLADLHREKAYNQKANLSDSIWKRIRPILEPGIQTRRDVRLAFMLREATISRRKLLEQFCINYKNTISPLLWKYLPHAVEISKKDPFKDLIDAPIDTSITIDDFTALMSKVPEVTTEIQDEMKALLVERLTLALNTGKILPSNCLDLATSTFRCEGPACKSFRMYIVGIDDIVSHNCGSDVSHYGSGYYIDTTLHWSRDFAVDSFAVENVRSIILCAGLDPENALASEMDNKDLRFACNRCGNRNPVGYSWRTALIHVRLHSDLASSDAKNWRVLAPTEAAFLKENEQKDPKWKMAKWSCSRCPIALHDGGMHREAVLQHIRTAHKIFPPAVPTDLFFFEKVVSPLHQWDRHLYALPIPPPKALPKPTPNSLNKSKNVKCLMCASSAPLTRNRQFLQAGVIAHLKAKHSITQPERGVHWAPS